MGKQVKVPFSQLKDEKKFAKMHLLLSRERRVLEGELKGGFRSEKTFIGGELELCLVDKKTMKPKFVSERVLKRLSGTKGITCEYSRHNLEINTSPSEFKAGCLFSQENELSSIMSLADEAAGKEGAAIVAVGTLPTLKLSALAGQMYPMPRYRIIEHMFSKLRRRKISVNISDLDGRAFKLSTRSNFVAATMTSLQQHHELKRPEDLHRALNFSLILDGPILALFANSLFLDGRPLNMESRIHFYEQVDDDRTDNDRIFGAEKRAAWPEKYFSSYSEPFDRVLRFPPLVPYTGKRRTWDPRNYEVLMLANGGIHSWARPVIDPVKRTVRVENRPFPALPVEDAVSAQALYHGAIHYLLESGASAVDILPHELAIQNFYSAAELSKSADLWWKDGVGRIKKVSAKTACAHVISISEKGLKLAGIKKNERRKYLDNAVLKLWGHSPAEWQYELHKEGKSPAEITRILHENRHGTVPAHAGMSDFKGVIGAKTGYITRKFMELFEDGEDFIFRWAD